MSHQLKWSNGVATSPFGSYAIETIFGRYHLVLTSKGKSARIGGDYPTPAKAKASAQIDCDTRLGAMDQEAAK